MLRIDSGDKLCTHCCYSTVQGQTKAAPKASDASCGTVCAAELQEAYWVGTGPLHTARLGRRLTVLTHSLANAP
jgi:hypothetical protein